ncbi:MAG TPA: TIR domain-containing protein, partial [Caulobacteraceae bacterium]
LREHHAPAARETLSLARERIGLDTVRRPMSDIFISYARSTEVQAGRIAEALRGLGYGVWRDDELPAHRVYSEVIEERLKAAKAVVVVWSADAVKSQWVRSEADKARADRKLVQLSLDGSALPMPFDQIQCADLAGWTGTPDAPGWLKVVASVADLTSRSGKGAQTSRPTARPHAICVLPFANMSGDVDQEYFSDGISEDIITDLSKVSALSVVARNTAFTFKGKAVDVPQVARQLNVGHVLEGSVRKAGPRVRITAQLIDGAGGDHVWAERWDRDLTDIFALQDEISEAIVGAVKLRLAPEEKKAIEKRGTGNPDAYNLYLMARQQYVTGNQGDERREEAIIRLTRRATQIDPDYARAWSLMALAQTSLRFRYGREGDDGLAAAERALELDPELAEPHTVKARHLREQGLDEAARAEVDVALGLDPESFEVNLSAGYVNFRQHRFEDAIRFYDKAASLSEGDYLAAGTLQSCYSAIDDKDGMARAAKMTLARAEAAVAQDQSNGSAMGFAAVALAVLGETERAKAWIERALMIDPDNLNMRYNFACAMCVHAEDAEAAIDLMGPVLATTTLMWLNHIKIDPDLRVIASNPRFQAMIAAAEARLGTGAPEPSAGEMSGAKTV